MNAASPPVDIIVPVFRDFPLTVRCIESVLASDADMPFELVVINDCSPEPELLAWLREQAEAGRLTLLENEENLGFVQSVNRGMVLHPQRDVVLLNSDAEVANDWLDRLHACAWQDGDIGTVTPFSNNATICSYPFDGWTGGVPGSLGLAQLDRLFAEVNHGLSVELPTAVGFCMYIRRACLDETGLFDAGRFGPGYGEENDFSRRASNLGWRNLLAADVFVYHAGGVSFSTEREFLQKKALATLLELHPDYLDQVGDFIRRDPARPLRKAIDRMRAWHGPAELRHLREERALCDGGRADPRPVVLHVSHSWGGGIERWLADFRQADKNVRNLVLRSRSERNFAGWRVELMEPVVSDIPLQGWSLQEPIAAVSLEQGEYRQILDYIVGLHGVQAVFVSSLLGHDLAVLETGLPTVVVLHDYTPYCPAIYAWFDGVCTSCDGAKLSQCLQSNPLNEFWHNTTTDDWLQLREGFVRRLRAKNIRLAAPGQSICDGWWKFMPVLQEKGCEIIPHGLDTVLWPSLPQAEAGSDDRLRIVIPGRLNLHKGLPLLQSVLPDLLVHAELLLLGCGEQGELFSGLDGVRVIREYAHHEMAGHLADFAPDCALLLSILPESFSYTLSEMFAFGLPVLATRLGAFAERVVHGGTGLLFEPDRDMLLQTVEFVRQNRDRLDAMRESVSRQKLPDRKEMVTCHLQLLPTLQPRRQSLQECWQADVQEQERDRLGEISFLRGALRDASARLRERAARVEFLEEENKRLLAEKSALLNSTSWRLTAPVRGLKRLAKQNFRDGADVEGDMEAWFEPSATRIKGRHVFPPHVMEGVVRKKQPVLHSHLCHALGIPDRCRLLLLPELPDEAAMQLVLVWLEDHNAHHLLLQEGLEASLLPVELHAWKARRRVLECPGNFLAEDVLLAVDAVLTDGVLECP